MFCLFKLFSVYILFLAIKKTMRMFKDFAKSTILFYCKIIVIVIILITFELFSWKCYYLNVSETLRGRKKMTMMMVSLIYRQKQIG